ncbi:MAG: glycosyltransferase family 9 protein [Gammaproteobacteria bacterium]|nr:glycosyltransferase family 9 protein [Gammaproteobacteria bacterium]MBQ0841176.1 glycosyltransferase family 9 protein [Gammaproteobacteria bacterium]
MPTKHMGNLLVSLHGIVALVKANQGESLVVIDEAYRCILESIPEILDVLYYPLGQLLNLNALGKLNLLREFYGEIRTYRAKLLLNFDAQKLSTVMAILSGVNIRFGLPNSPYGRFYTKIIDSDEDRLHQFYQYDRYAQHFLEIHGAAKYPRLQPVDKHRASVNKILRSHGFCSRRPYICIHPGATKDYKKWPVENFSRTADWLANQGYQVLFIGAGTSDRSVIEEVVRQCTQKPISLCDELNLGELIALFSEARFFLGNDSGPMHLASAAGAQVFSIFGPTDEHRWGSLGDKSRVVRNVVRCEEACSKKFCTQSFRCIKSLSVEDVKSVLAEYIESSSEG